jgi:hypothetical protein
MSWGEIAPRSSLGSGEFSKDETDCLAHGLINYKDTKPETLSLLVFWRLTEFNKLEIQSVTLVFLTRFVNCCPSNLLSG